MDLELRRRYFAEELEAVCRLRSAALVEALATVRRERFLPPGPWTVLVDAVGGLGSGIQTRTTPDADPARVCHNIGVAIDPQRQLFNGHPGTIAPWIDALDLAAGARVLHVGCGLGYYTAIVAHMVGAAGRVRGYEVDPALAAAARVNLGAHPWVDVRCGDASEALESTFDAILVNAGLTHAPDTWLDCLADGGRAVLPITATMGAMGSNIGKGPVVLITKQTAARFSARVAGFVAIYTAAGLRDDRLNEQLEKALMAGPMRWQTITRLRRDPHPESESCWLHGPGFCLGG
jgi:protein-L-isoaspartate(D-aspartate) O-methyltransferase